MLYLVGGSGELPSNWIYDGRANLIMDNLLAEKTFSTFLNDPDVNQKVDYLFVGQGTAEVTGPMGQRCMALHNALTKHNVRHEYYVGGDSAHDGSTWRHLLYCRFLPNLWRQN